MKKTVIALAFLSLLALPALAFAEAASTPDKKAAKPESCQPGSTQDMQKILDNLKEMRQRFDQIESMVNEQKLYMERMKNMQGQPSIADAQALHEKDLAVANKNREEKKAQIAKEEAEKAAAEKAGTSKKQNPASENQEKPAQ